MFKQILKDFSYPTNFSKKSFKICPPSKTEMGIKLKVKIIKLTKTKYILFNFKKTKTNIKFEKQPDIKTKNSFKNVSCLFFFILSPKTLKEIPLILTENKVKNKMWDSSWTREDNKQINAILLISKTKNQLTKHKNKKDIEKLTPKILNLIILN